MKPSIEQLDWNTAKSEQSVASFTNYLESHPKGKYSEIAQNFLDSVGIQEVWDLAKNDNTVKGYQKYLNFAAIEKDSLNNILQYSKYANDTLTAIKRIDSLKDQIATSNLDHEAWVSATEKNSLGSYLRYIKNDSILGTHNDDAYKKIQEIGKNGFLYCGRVVNNKISDPIFSIVYRKEGEFKTNGIPQANDMVLAKKNRYIYKDLNVNYKSGNSIEVNKIYLVKSVSLQANAVFLEIIYEP